MGKFKVIELLDLDATALSANNYSAGKSVEVGGIAGDTGAVIVELDSVTGGDGTTTLDVEPLACANAARDGAGAMNIYNSFSVTTVGSQQSVSTGAAPGSSKAIWPLGRMVYESRQLPPFIALNIKKGGTAYTGGRVRAYLALM